VFSVTDYEEAVRNLQQWSALAVLAQQVYDSLDAATRTAFFQMVLHPVLAGQIVVQLYTKVAFNKLYAAQGRVSANQAALDAQSLFAQDAALTNRYHTMKGGKWNHVIDQVHIGYTSWNEPGNNKNVMPNVTFLDSATTGGSVGVSVQGSSASYTAGSKVNIRSMDPYMPPGEQRYVDIYARKNGTYSWSISSNASYLTVSPQSGTINAPGNGSDARSVISIDWTQVTSGISVASLNITIGSDIITANVPVNKTTIPAGTKAFVESNGVISIEAAHYSNPGAANATHVEIPHYGKTLSGVMLWPVTTGTKDVSKDTPLTYSLYTTTTTSKARLIVMFGASLNYDPTRPLKFAYSLDGSTPATVAPVTDIPVYKEGKDWSAAIQAGGWTSTIALTQAVTTGAHVLSIWLLEPGLIIQKVVLDMGGLKTSALGPPESASVSS